MKPTKPLIVACLSSLFCALPVAGQIGETKAHDPRIEQILDAVELKYTIDDDGDFKTINQLADGRTQVVFVNSATEKYGDLEIREVWSVGHISEKQLSPAIMRILLKQNGEMKLGSWKIATLSGKEAAVFYAQIAAESNKSTLLRALQLVTEAADEMEAQLTEEDDL